MLARWRFIDLNGLPSSRQMMWSGVMLLRIDTAGACGSGSGAATCVVPASAPCTPAIRRGRASAAIALFDTKAETMSAVMPIRSVSAVSSSMHSDPDVGRIVRLSLARPFMPGNRTR
ncbi:hypothetical protein D3C86_1471730 [compost metagenome]